MLAAALARPPMQRAQQALFNGCHVLQPNRTVKLAPWMAFLKGKLAAVDTRPVAVNSQPGSDHMVIVGMVIVTQ